MNITDTERLDWLERIVWSDHVADALAIIPTRHIGSGEHHFTISSIDEPRSLNEKDLGETKSSLREAIDSAIAQQRLTK